MRSTRKILPLLALASTLGFGGLTAHAQTLPSDLKTSTVLSSAPFEALLKVPSRQVDSAAAGQALKAFGLNKSGQDVFKWDARTGTNGNYLFKSLRASDGSGTMSVGTMTFKGLRMEDDQVMFDNVDMRNVTLNAGKTGELGLGRISLSDPSPELANEVARFFKDPESVDFDDYDFDPGAIGAIYLADMSFRAESSDFDGSFSMAEMGWGESDLTGEGSFLIRALNLVGQSSDDIPVDMSIGLVDVSGLDMEYFGGIIAAMDGSDADLDAAMMGQNPFKQQYQSIQMSDIAIKADTAEIKLEGLTGRQTKSGTVLTSQYNLKPFSFGFAGEPTDPEMREAKASLDKVGITTLSISAHGQNQLDEKDDSFSGEDFYKFADAMDTRLKYSGNGIGHFITAMRAVEDAENMTDDETKAVFGELSLDFFELSMRDNTMIDTILKLASAESGETPDMLKVKAKSMLMMGSLMAQNASQMALAGSASRAFTSLLDEGGEVTITIDPDMPITLETIMAYEGVEPKDIDISNLGITVTHKK